MQNQTLDKKIIKIIEELIKIHKADKQHFIEVSNIFFSLSEISTDQELRSLCIDGSVVTGEAIYNTPAVMSFEEFEDEYKMLAQKISA